MCNVGQFKRECGANKMLNTARCVPESVGQSKSASFGRPSVIGYILTQISYDWMFLSSENVDQFKQCTGYCFGLYLEQ